MKQILQNLGDGQTELADIPCPRVKPGHLLIRTTCTLVSAGTERMLVEFGKANLIDKARQQPDKVKVVLDKVKTDGLMTTMEAVRSKFDQSLPLGYCNVGIVMEVGADVQGFQVGDRVVSNGKHAEVVCVPKNLCAKVPESVSDEEAAFTVLAAIGLQGVRLIQPTLGEVFVVTGLGLIGLVTVQLLRAHGCRVLGIDFDPAKLELARHLGAEIVDLSKGEDPLTIAQSFSRNRGVDGVLITASTKSNEPVSQAAKMCRKRGRIVLVGVTGLELSRADFYEKELTFQVSCSYGPGRYDPGYEEKGQDYPVGFVRWTEQRNFEAILDMLASGALNMEPLISHRFPLHQAEAAYQLLGSDQPSLGILLEYPGPEEQPNQFLTRRIIHLAPFPLKVAGGRSGLPPRRGEGQEPVVGFVGAGNYAGRVLIPAFKKARATLHSVATSGGVSGVHFGKKFGFVEATTDTEVLLANPAINTVVVATQHNTHARFVCKALQADKHVFVEKPLCLTQEELAEITNTYSDLGKQGFVPILMVGFNRRFAPQVVKMKSLLDGVKEPKAFIMTVNAGAIPPDHWTQDPEIGGGRIIGEGCHFVDLLRFLAGAPIVDSQPTFIGDAPGVTVRGDKVSCILRFADGSFGTVHYLANGHKSFSKERLEVFCANRVLVLDNFCRLRGYGWPGFKKMNLWRQDKGQDSCVAAFLESIRRGKSSPIPFDELSEVSRLSIQIANSLHSQ